VQTLWISICVERNSPH